MEDDLKKNQIENDLKKNEDDLKKICGRQPQNFFK